MKKSVFAVIAFLFCCGANAQVVLNVPTVIQEQDNWCWAGSTKCVMDYYNTNLQQCQIAEYTRSVAVWHYFGSTDCCTNPTVGCNYWNYNWGYAGSMQDILVSLGSISNYGQGSSLSMSEVTNEINAGRPFIIRWGWLSGGGHFIVGKGYDAGSNSVYYMNPWPGEGAKVATHAWMLNDGNHDWTSTNVITTNPSPSGLPSQNNTGETIEIFPNPASGQITVRSANSLTGMAQLYDVTGKLVKEKSFDTSASIDVSSEPAGIYLLKISAGESVHYKKVILR